MAAAEPSDGVARALGRIPSGLFVVTAGQGEATQGMLASWVQQAGFTPPAITLALKEERAILPQIRTAPSFCIAILPAEAKDLLRFFAPGVGPGLAAFHGVELAIAPDGTPYPRNCLAWMSCRPIAEARFSDHVLIGAEVVAGDRLAEAAPFVHVRRNGLSY